MSLSLSNLRYFDFFGKVFLTSPAACIVLVLLGQIPNLSYLTCNFAFDKLSLSLEFPLQCNVFPTNFSSIGPLWASFCWCEVKFSACPVWFALRPTEVLTSNWPQEYPEQQNVGKLVKLTPAPSNVLQMFFICQCGKCSTTWSLPFSIRTTSQLFTFQCFLFSWSSPSFSCDYTYDELTDGLSTCRWFDCD